jgi:hypothetical protein
MSIFHIKLLDWEATQFDLDLKEVIVPIHKAAVTSLQGVHYDGELALQEAILEAEAAGDEGQWQLEQDMAKVEKKRAIEREQVIGWLALLHLGIVLELKLNKLYDLLEGISLEQGRRAIPMRGNRRTRSERHWLRKLSDRYQQYGVSLGTHPKFSLIDEMVFACNAVKHSAGKPGENYRNAHPDCRFVDEELIVFSNKDFKDLVDSLREFVEWVVREIKHRRDGQIPVGPLQRPRPTLRD